MPVVPWVGELILHVSRHEHLLAAKTNPQFSEGLDLHSGFGMHSDSLGMRLFLLSLPTIYKGNQRKATKRRSLFQVKRYMGRVGYVIICVHIQRTNISPASLKKEVLTDLRSLVHCAQQMIELDVI